MYSLTVKTGCLNSKRRRRRNGAFTENDGSKFNWAFSQKVELTFGVGRHRSQEQKLVGFAYEVTQQPKVAGCGSNEKPTTSIPDFAKNDRPVVVIFGGHGVPVEQMSRGGFLGGCVGKTYVDKLQANVLALNYRGYGESTSGITSNRSMVEDGVAIVNHLLDSGVDPKRIVLHGYSMGGNIAANVLQAAEAKGSVLGGLILDRSMEKLSTGAATMSATKSDSVSKRVLCNYFLSPLTRSVAYCLAESYSTRLAIKGIQKHRTPQVDDQCGLKPPKYSTPIVAVYDNDPIGSTTKRMCKKYGIENWETGEGHDAGFGATLDALEELRDNNGEDSSVGRLLKIFEAEPQKTAEQSGLNPDAAELISVRGVSSLKAEAESNNESEKSRMSPSLEFRPSGMFFSPRFDAKKLREETWKQTDSDL